MTRPADYGRAICLWLVIWHVGGRDGDPGCAQNLDAVNRFYMPTFDGTATSSSKSDKTCSS
jgi:hypothetical protein